MRGPSVDRLERLNQTFLNIGPDFDQNVQRLTAACGEILGADSALYSRVQAGLLRSVGRWQTPADFNPVDRPDGQVSHEVIKRGKEGGIFILRNLPGTAYFKTDPMVAKNKIRTYAGRAVCLFGQSVGALCVLYRDDVQLDENDQRILEIVSTALGIEEERKRVEDDRMRLASFPELDPNPIIEAGLAGHVTYLNPEAERLFPDLFNRGVKHPFLQGFQSATEDIKSRGKVTREVRIGDIHYQQVMHYVPASKCVRVYAFDITELKRNERELIAAKEVAEEANRAKNTFLANMSHELRTPLNSVIGFANILLKNKLKNLRDQDISFLDRILTNGKHLLGLINNILDLSKIEAGRMELTLSTLPLEALVQETVSQLEGQTRDRNIKLILDIPATLKPLKTDPEKLKQVLINLIGNAIKFTKEGSVTVRIHPDANGAPARIDVMDTGIGIPKDKLLIIFNPFQQVDTSSTRQYGGTGLGLTISRSLCGLMGYEIKVASAPGKGSTFSVFVHDVAQGGTVSYGLDYRGLSQSLGRAEGKDADPPASLEAIRLEDKLVLVIDDESDSRILISQFLEDFGCKVIAASSGEQGIRMAKEFNPDLITLDLMMADKNGWDVLKDLKTVPSLWNIPVVIISIVAKEKRGSVTGAVDILPKPLVREDLLKALQRNLHLERGKVLIVEDDKDARFLLMDSLERKGFHVQTATNGLEALKALETFHPDLVLTDLMMPVMDGLSFLSSLRKNPKWANLPVIVVTAKDMTASDLEHLHAETLAVIRKGDELERELKRIVQELFKNQKSSAPR